MVVVLMKDKLANRMTTMLRAGIDVMPPSSESGQSGRQFAMLAIWSSFQRSLSAPERDSVFTHLNDLTSDKGYEASVEHLLLDFTKI
jgi:hypothetical protein